MGPLSSNASSFKDVVLWVVGIIHLIIPVLFALGLVIFLWSGVRYIYKAGGESHGKERDALLWGLIALFVAFSVWGILGIACATLVGNSSCSTTGGTALKDPLNIIPPSVQ